MIHLNDLRTELTEIANDELLMMLGGSSIYGTEFGKFGAIPAMLVPIGLVDPNIPPWSRNQISDNRHPYNPYNVSSVPSTSPTIDYRPRH